MKRILLLAGVAGAGVAAYVLLRSPGVIRPIGRTGPGAADAGVREVGRMTPDAGVPYVRRSLARDGGAGGAAAASGGAVEVERPESVSFEREERDVGWASEQEKEMALRMRRVVDVLADRETLIDIDAIECRHQQCRVAVHARDESALGRFYAQLESPEGLYGWADNLLLAPVVTAPDGQVTTHFVAYYERE